MSADFTIVIPTHNRHALINALLPTLCEFEVPILVLDSSDEPNELLARDDRVEYVRCNGMRFAEKLQKHIETHVRTSFMMMNADDVYPVKSTVFKCLNFLKENPDYSSAQGASYYNHNGVFRKYRDDFELYQADSQRPSVRVMQHWLCEAHNFYSVMRTDNWVRILNHLPAIQHLQLIEMFQILVTLINGKAMRFGDFHHLVDEIESVPSELKDRGLLWDNAQFRSEYDLLRKAVVRLLREKEPMPDRCAHRYLDAALAVYRQKNGIPKPPQGKFWQWNPPKEGECYLPVAHPFERINKEVRRFLNKTVFKKQLQARRRLKREKMVQEGRDLLTRVLDNADVDARQEILAIIKQYYPGFAYQNELGF